MSELDSKLTVIADKINELSSMDYHNDDYDHLEEEIHELEDKLMEDYGKYLEEVFNDVHDEYCSDNDVLMPIAYLAHKYLKTESGYDVPASEGVPVDADDFPGKDTKLVLVPSPVRILLQVDDSEKIEVWRPN